MDHGSCQGTKALIGKISLTSSEQTDKSNQMLLPNLLLCCFDDRVIRSKTCFLFIISPE